MSLTLVPKKLQAVNNFITVKPVNVIGGLIAIPETVEHFFFYGTLTSVGKKCSKVIKPGMQVFCKRKNGKQFGDKGWVFKEEDILLVMWRGQWHPLGNKLLVMRETEEQLRNGILISACRHETDQTLFGIVIRKGLIAELDDFEDKYYIEEFDYPIESGDKIKIREWDMLIEEVGIENMNCVILKPSHLDYKVTNVD